MKTDPTSSVSGAASMPLAYEAIQSGRNATTHSDVKATPKDAIADTLETTDREGDGRQVLDYTLGTGQQNANDPEPQDRLDLTG
jgi:hypothetical protein